MAYSAKVGSFNIDTAKTVGQTQAISGVGFQPKIVLFFWGGSTGTGDTVAGGTYSGGFGAAISSTSRCCVAAVGLDNQASSDTNSTQLTSKCIRGYIATSGADGDMDFSSMDADGFTLIVDDQFTQAFRVSYLALGGDDLTNVDIQAFNTATSTGNYDVTTLSFQPDVLIFPFSVGAADVRLGFGWATGASNQGVVFAFSDDAAATTSSYGYGYNGECIAYSSSASWSSASTNRESFVEFLANGFRLNHLEGINAFAALAIALKGGQYSVGDITTRTDGNDISETVGFQPAAIMFASANRVLSTQDTKTDHARLSIGAATSTSNRAVAAISDEDNLADSETAYANYDSAVYANIADDAIVGLMDIKSIDASGFTAVMDDADPAGCWVTYLAIGAAAGATFNGKVDTCYFG